MFSWGEKLLCPYLYTHEDIREFESNNSLEARIGKQMCMVTRSIQVWKDKKCISEPANCQQTPLSKFVIWFMTC